MSKIEKKKAIALFSYTAAYEDELSFNQGDVLLVTELTSIEEGWYQAEKDGKAGIVPGNYLEFINDNPASGGGDQDRSTTESAVQTTPPQAPYRFKTANLAGLQRDNEVAVLQWLMGVFLVTIKAIERRTKKKVNEDKALMWWGVIKKHYCEKTRFYHTYQHLVDLCKHVEQYQNKLKRPELVRMTVFFHDVIYDATKRDNEERSAQMWTTFSQELHLPPADVDAVHEWIMATAKHMYATPERNSDMAYFLDFDLSVLGRERDAYERYSREIRQEYSHFPEVEYRAGRGGVLAMFLSTERLFFTDDVHAALEARARENIAWEIELLQQPIGIDVHLQEEADRLAREAAAATEVVNKQVEETLSAAADTLASFSPVLARHLGRPVPGDEPTTTASSTTSTSTSTSTPTTATATTTSTSPPSTSSSPPVRTIPAFRPRGAFAEAASKQ